jgi:hypothetical protein
VRRSGKSIGQLAKELELTETAVLPQTEEEANDSQRTSKAAVMPMVSGTSKRRSITRSAAGWPKLTV